MNLDADAAKPLDEQTGRARREWMLGVAAASAALGGAAWQWWPSSKAYPPVPEAWWQATFEGPDGVALHMANLRGKPLVINFWATWCTPCVEEMPLLSAFYRQQSANGWQVLGLAIDQPSMVRRFLSQFPVTYPIGLAGMTGTEWGRMLGNTQGGLPFTVVLNAKGAVIDQHLGKLSADHITAWR